MMQQSGRDEGSRDSEHAFLAGSSWQIWLGRLALAVLSPLLVLASFELVCRTLGWGYPTSFLVPDRIRQKNVWRTNEFYGYRFFEPLMARSPTPLHVDRAKPPGVRRVAVLGESAAMGDPLIEFGLARALDKMLNLPGEPRRYEVINAAMTAISSPVVVDIARELARRDVDVFVVYMGNNEVVGPYGPATVFRRGGLGGWFTPWHVAWTRTRMASAIQAWRAGKTPGEPWDGMTMLARNRMAATDSRLQGVYADYERHLGSIAATAARHGIDVVLCTVGVNLRDCPPFGSAHGRTLSTDETRRWREALSTGTSALGAGDVAAARDAFAVAMEIDPDHAELNYLVATAADRAGDTTTAGRHYGRARDLDTLRVRADGRMNDLVRAVAARHGLPLVESDGVFGSAPGMESFVDHVHFTIGGVWMLADAVATVIQQATGGNRAGVDVTTLATRMGHDAWSRSKLAAIMLARLAQPPFRDQAGNADRLRKWRERRRSAELSLTAENKHDALEELEQEHTAYPWDDEYDVQAMHRLAGTGDWPRAAEVADRIRSELRGASAVRGLVGLVYARSGRPCDAVDVLVTAGPPYGYFLVDATFQLLTALQDTGATNAGLDVATGILDRIRDFPGRAAITRWKAEAGARPTDHGTR